jgi:DNA-binding NtrC family response regulator
MPKKKPVILIAERNPHIRNLVQRELMAEDYHVFTVDNVFQLKNWIYLRRAPDILVLDPELPGSEEHNIWGLLASYPELPVIIHCLCADQWKDLNGLKRSALVEKNGNSINFLKHQIMRIDSEYCRGN